MRGFGGFLTANLYAPLFAWPAAVVRHGRDVLDGLDIQTGRLQRGDGAFSSAARSTNLDVDILNSELCRFFRSLLRRTLAGKWSTLAASLESASSGTGPTQRVLFGVRYRHKRIVK